jgi:hypothetical protein
VTVSQIGINSLITVGGDTYFFNLLGFSTNGGATIKNVFQSPEGGNNSAGLYAMVTPCTGAGTVGVCIVSSAMSLR